MSIRYVDNEYEVHEDSVSRFQMPGTDAATIATVVNDIVICTFLPLPLCRGQADDGAAVMQGKRTGVVTRLKQEEAAAIPVHCLAHFLNLCLQDASRKINVILHGMDVVKEIIKLITMGTRLSKHRLFQFSII